MTGMVAPRLPPARAAIPVVPGHPTSGATAEKPEKARLTSNPLVTYSPRMARVADEVSRAIADPSRRRILALLGELELPLKRIQARFDMSRPAVIKHLRVLKSCRLVQVRRQGRQTMHRLNPRPLRAVRNWVMEFDRFWDSHLARLKAQVEGEI